ncbi:MAG: NTP transferase domain-containing protein [Flammeovirgaceae bacterium]|nr:NTP transferase domain-containing protein [Flammeovirgaceae bacterium]
MGSSLKLGLKNLTDRFPETEAVLIMVCDQPYLTTEHLKNYRGLKKPNTDIITSFYNQTKGVPALFKNSLFSKLMQLNDTEGARKIIQTFKGSIIDVPFEKGEIDLDTPDDLRHLV